MRKKQTVRLTESQLMKMIDECVKQSINEVSAELADRAAGKAYKIGREGFGKYGKTDELPLDSPHGKKYQQGEKFLKYRNDKLGGKHGIGIYYPNGDDSVMVLKNYDTGEIITGPCHSVAELESEYNKYKVQNESIIDKAVKESVKKVVGEGVSKINPDATYIVFDGTSHYPMYGFDIMQENDPDIEIVKGPYAKWTSDLDYIVDDLNDEAYGKPFS